MELSHVRWVLGELGRWDVGVVSAGAREFISARYRQQERVLRAALGERVEPAPPVTLPPMAEPPAEEALPIIEAELAPPPVPMPPASAVQPQVPAAQHAPPTAPRPGVLSAEAASVDDQIVEQASRWHRIWKPFLNESVGWFIGGFLILVGTLYWVADAWGTMSGITRSLTVFGFAAAWTVGFAAWARFLSRRESTQRAGRLLALIAAAVAPLPPVALGPIAFAAPLVFVPTVLAWSALVFFFTRGVAKAHAEDVWPAAGAALTAAVMGAAPMFASQHSAIWLTALPLFTFIASARRGPRERPAFALLAPLYLVALFGIRLHLAVGGSTATWAPFAAAALYGALELKRADKADVWSIGAISAQVVLLVVSAAGDPPALFVTSALLCASSVRLMRGSPRWLYPAYLGAYFAFQTCGQLVPAQLQVLLAHLREALGYPASQSLPAAYDAVYAALFVLAGGLLGTLRLRATPALRDPLLSATALASALVGVMGAASLFEDPRPSLWSAPLVAALCLGLGPAYGRRALSWVGAGLAALAGASVLASIGAEMGGVVVGALALLLAALSVPLRDGHRQALAAAAGALAVLAIGAAFYDVDRGAWPCVVAVMLASAAGLLAGLSLGSRRLLALAFFGPALLAPKLALVFAPNWVGLALAASAMVLAIISRLQFAAPSAPSPRPGERNTAESKAGRRSWLGAAALAGGVSGALAPLVHLIGVSRETPWAGITLLVSAAALLLGRRNAVAHLLGISFAFLAVLPIAGARPLPWMTGALAGYLALATALGASFWSAFRGRSWRPALVATLSLALALSCGLSPSSLGVAALTALLATRALVPAVTLPLATALAAGASFFHPVGLVAIGLVASACALLEEWNVTWRHLLGEKGSAWPASLSALAVAPLTLRMTAAAAPHLHVAVAFTLAASALLWIRGTRWPFFALVMPGLMLAPRALGASSLHVWLPVLAVVAVSRAVQLSQTVRGWLAVHSPRALENALAVGLALTGAAFGLTDRALGLTGTALPLSGGVSMLPFAVGLLLAAAEPAAWRVAAATAFALAVPGLANIAAVALLALGLAARHSPKAARWVLGDGQRGWTVTAAAVCSVACAGYAAALQPSAPGPGLSLAGCLAGCAVLLGFRWLLSLAVLAVALPLSVALQPQLTIEASTRAVLSAAVVAALAALSRVPRISSATLRRCAHVGRAFDGPLATPLWLGAFVTLTFTPAWGTRAPLSMLPLVLGGCALLLVTGVAWEAGAAIGLTTVTLALWLPQPICSSIIALVALALCAAGAVLEKRQAVGRVWHHAGWVAALLAVGLLPGLDRPGTAVTLAAAAGCLWCVAARKPKSEWLAWAGTAVAAHGVLFFAGSNLGHGQPHALILPWAALVSTSLGAVALSMGASSGESRAPSRQRYGAGIAALMLGLTEASIGALLLDTAHPREALVSFAAVAVAAFALARRVKQSDDSAAAALTQVAAAVGFVAIQRLGFSATPGATAAFAALGFGAVLGGLQQVLPPRAAASARTGAWGWPLLGLLAAPLSMPWVVSALLLAQAAHFTVMGRTHRRFALLGSLAFNAALAVGWSAAGIGHPQYLLVPLGLTALVLLAAFSAEFEPSTVQRLRAGAVTVIYAATAFEPLAMPTPWALWLCSVVCVLGVAVGIALKVKSYVFLGTGFLVTTVVASLTRYGIQEPRVGALLLSGLGLLIVGFMVLVTTRRSEVLQRYQRARTLLAQWQG
jgi:hypothetical protein